MWAKSNVSDMLDEVMSIQVLRKLDRYVISSMTALEYAYKLIIRYVSISSGPSGTVQNSTPQTSSLRDRKGTVLIT